MNRTIETAKAASPQRMSGRRARSDRRACPIQSRRQSRAVKEDSQSKLRINPPPYDYCPTASAGIEPWRGCDEGRQSQAENGPSEEKGRCEKDGTRRDGTLDSSEPYEAGPT